MPKVVKPEPKKQAGLKHMLFRRRPFSDLGIIAGGLLLLQAVAEQVMPHYWVVSNLSTFCLQYAILAAASAVLLLLAKRRAPASLAVMLALWYLVPVLYFYIPPDGEKLNPAAAPLKVLYANVFTRNQETALLGELVNDFQPDIVALAETGRHWAEALQYLRDSYPYRLERFRDDNFGIALYSRLPLTHNEILSAPQTNVPSIRARCYWQDEEITVFLTHPLPPSTPGQFVSRNQQLAWLASLVKEESNPVVLVGDLNATETVAAFAKFMQMTGLADSRQGFGWQPSWPRLFVPALIPIDHALVSDEWRVIDRRLGPDIGSDHYPVCLTVALVS